MRLEIYKCENGWSVLQYLGAIDEAPRHVVVPTKRWIFKTPEELGKWLEGQANEMGGP